MAKTHDLRVGGGGALPFQNSPIAVLKGEIDLAEYPLTSGQKAAVIPIPADTLLEGLQWEVETEEGAAGTVDIGVFKASDDSAVDADGLVDGLDINTAAKGYTTPTVTQSTTETPYTVGITPAYWAGKYLTEECYIGVSFASGAAANAKIILRAKCLALYN